MAISAHHRLALRGAHGPLTFSLDATLSAPWTVLFGPSGSGKTTLLRALAGVEPALNTTFDRHDPATGTWQPLSPLPPERRHLAYAPQQALLIPHLTAEENIRFPEAVRNLPLHRSQLPAVATLLALQPLLPRLPRDLSGGERQRVALARALTVPGAQLLLLDEPFAGLDRNLRDNLVPPLQAYLVQRNLPVLSVTHDPDEALLLGAEILRLHDGQRTDQGPATRVLADEIARLRALLPPSPLT